MLLWLHATCDAEQSQVTNMEAWNLLFFLPAACLMGWKMKLFLFEHFEEHLNNNSIPNNDIYWNTDCSCSQLCGGRWLHSIHSNWTNFFFSPPPPFIFECIYLEQPLQAIFVSSTCSGAIQEPEGQIQTKLVCSCQLPTCHQWPTPVHAPWSHPQTEPFVLDLNN